MPIKYKPFTAEEKKQILNRHKELVDEMNKYLPTEQKLTYDKNLEAKLDSNETAGIYRIGQEMHEIHQKQKQILNNLESRFGKCQVRNNKLARSFVYALNPNNTDEAKAYNEKLYRDYLEDPNKVIYMRYRKMIDIDPTAAYNTNDDKLKMAEFYRDTYPLCDEAYVFASVCSGDQITPELKDAVDSMKKPLEVIGYPQNVVKGTYDLDYFATPELTMEQAQTLMNKGQPFMLNATEPIITKIQKPIEESEMDKPHDYFQKMVDNGVDLEEGTLVENKPIRNTESGENINARYDALWGPDEARHALTERTDEQQFRIRCMNKSFQKEYAKAWGKAFQQKYNEINDFDLNRIEDRHKGGFFERYIRHSTSREYKEMSQALKDFHNPESEHFCDRTYLRGKAQGYIDHKHAQGYENVNQMKGTSKIRTELALNIISVTEDLDEDKVEQDWFKDYNVYKENVKEGFLKPEDVQEKGVDVKNLQKDLEEEVELEDNLNVSM